MDKVLRSGLINPTNTPRGFQVEATWKQPFPRRFNVESTWYVCRGTLWDTDFKTFT